MSESGDALTIHIIFPTSVTYCNPFVLYYKFSSSLRFLQEKRKYMFYITLQDFELAFFLRKMSLID